MKKAVMVIAPEKFRDEELLEPKEVLEKAGIAVSVASMRLDGCRGTLGTQYKADMLFRDVRSGDYDAFIFVGGAGASVYWDDPSAHALAVEAAKKNKIVAAICIAPVTLAKAGLLQGKRATVWPSEASQLTAAGARYSASPVEKDGNIITGSGPAAAREFGEEILKALLGSDEEKK
ncbi:MAG: DJ-1/PfpI family protein [Candidatus Omnitrophica bacterium]|nr:DJ-1/PfpI family protein [Candidatus Omnitrophota bacterium]